jgi:hypothetical protein
LSRKNVVIADGAGRSIEAAGKPEGIRGTLKREQLVAQGAIIGEFGLQILFCFAVNASMGRRWTLANSETT